MQAERNYLIHPSYIIMILMILGISALFIGFSGSYIYTRVQQGVPPVQIPTLFYFNTIILLASSGCLIYANKAYKYDNTERYRQALILTLALTVLFLIAQCFAWKQLMEMNIKINHSTTASYLYLISIVHFLHLVAGIPFLAWFIRESYLKMKSPVSVLIYFSDISKKRKLNLINIYWHFLDVLWIYLIVFFVINLFI